MCKNLPKWISALLISLMIIASFGAGFSAGKIETFPYEWLQWAYWSTRDKVRPTPDIRQSQVFAPKRDVIFLGDSIIAGGNWNDMFPDMSISNRGTGGETVQEILLRIGDLKKQHAKVVVTLAGVNDVRRYTDRSSVIRAYKHLVNRLLLQGSSVAIVSTLQCNDSRCTDTQNMDIVAINDAMRQYATIHEDRVTFVDVDGLLSDDHGLRSKYTVDGIHPNTAGYRIIFAALKEVLPAQLARLRS